MEIIKIKKEIDTADLIEDNVLLKCGEIFLSANKDLVFNCLHCHQNFKILNFFREHLLQEHSSVENNSKLDEIRHEKSFPSSLAEKEINEKSATNLNANIKEERFSDNETSNIKFNVDTVKGSLNKSSQNLETKTAAADIKINVILNSKKVKIKRSDNANGCKTIPKGCWECDICHVITKRGIERRIHERTHKDLNKLICETCGKIYASKQRLRDHIGTHTGEKPFKCCFCPKTFHYQSSLKSHNQTHIGPKLFKCNQCEQSFTKKYEKRIHERKHHSNSNSKSKLLCTICNKTYTSNYCLALHIRRHEKMMDNPRKPFECSFCPNSFSSNANRNAHERLIHKGEYNYKCAYCGKGFLKLNKKREHEEIHTRVENPYKCDLCDCEYARKHGLLKHQKQKHLNN